MAAPVPVTPPPPPGRRRRFAAWRAQRRALPRLPFWLSTRAGPILAGCGGLYVLNGVLLGWGRAYEVLVGIVSPAAVDPSWCAWPLSITGWAAIPAFVGGTAGYLITAQIQTHQARDMAVVLDELRALAQPPTSAAAPSMPPAPPTNPGGGA